MIFFCLLHSVLIFYHNKIFIIFDFCTGTRAVICANFNPITKKRTKILNFRNNTFDKYTDKKTPLAKNYFFSALAGTVWFLQFFFYGMGESKLGNGASSWILHMAFIILVANMWGIVLKEWKGVSKKTKTTITLGVFTIILSVMLVGLGNSMK